MAAADAMTETDDRWMSASEAARYLGVTLITIYRFTKAGRLRPMRLGAPSGTLRYRKRELDALLVPDSDPQAAWRGQNRRYRRGERNDAPESG